MSPGLASGTAGTAMAIVITLRALPEPPPDGLLMGRHAVPGLFFLLTYAKTSGVLLTWLRDLLGGGDYEALLAEAAGAPVGCDGLVCLPHFSGTATPTFRNEVRGGFVGLTLGHGRAHLLRAAAEAVCFCARDAVALAAGAASRAGSPTYDTAANRGGGPMCGPGAAARPAPNAVRRRPLRDGGGQSSRQRTQGEARADAEASAPTIRELRMLGGAAQSDWWMQMMADVVRLPIAVPACANAAVLGAAIFGRRRRPAQSIEKGGRVLSARAPFPQQASLLRMPPPGPTAWLWSACGRGRWASRRVTPVKGGNDRNDGGVQAPALQRQETASGLTATASDHCHAEGSCRPCASR